MRVIFTLFLHAIVIMIRLARPGGFRSVVVESVLLRHQVLILNRGRKRAPNLRPSDRIYRGFVHPADDSGSRFELRHRLEAGDTVSFSQDANKAKVPAAVFNRTDLFKWRSSMGMM